MTKGGCKGKPSQAKVVARASSRSTGTVKSYHGQNGYGFITAAGIAGDLMFLRTDLPLDAKEVRGKFLDGRDVMFDVDYADGRSKATNIHIIARDGDMYAGRIKSFSEKNSYGFIESSMAPGKDIRFNRTDLEGLQPGVDLVNELVLFKPMRKPDGKMCVESMMFQSSKIASRLKHGGGGHFGGTYGQPLLAAPHLPGGLTMETLQTLVQMLGGHLPAANLGGGAKRNAGAAGLQTNAGRLKLPRQQSPTTTRATGQHMTGSIKSFNPAKKFGFITALGLTGDAFFMATDLPLPTDTNSVQQGMQVTFELVRTADGKLRARDITY